VIFGFRHFVGGAGVCYRIGRYKMRKCGNDSVYNMQNKPVSEVEVRLGLG